MLYQDSTFEPHFLATGPPNCTFTRHFVNRQSSIEGGFDEYLLY